MRDKVPLLLFIVGVLVCGLVIGYTTAPDGWYAGLNKPFFNPPAWVFAPAWTLLYIMIALAGWQVWRTGSALLQRIWWAALVMNFLWSPVFFGMKMIGAALIVILLLDALVIAFLVKTRNRDTVAFWLFVPYAFWLAYATSLNAAIFYLN